MQIDFNNVRRKAGESYNDLVRYLLYKNKEGIISFEDEDIEDIMHDLRNAIGAIMCTSENGDDGFKNLYNDPLLLVYGTFIENLQDESSYCAQ